MTDPFPLTPQIVRGLNDKLYEKRKAAALEIEKIIRDYLQENDFDRIKQIIKTLNNDFAYSIVPNSRNGGLISLAAAAIALGPNVDKYLEDIVPPVLSCFTDQDSRVRYYACESMYNITKVARGLILKYFNEIFDALSKLAADSELSVKNGAELLDRLIKDVVSEHSIYYYPNDENLTSEERRNMAIYRDENGEMLQRPNHITIFSVPRFIPLLSERIHSLNPFTRQFLVQWISVLDTIPDIELIAYLPDYLDGLFNYLSDPNMDVRVATLNVLSEFLREIRQISEIQSHQQKINKEKRKEIIKSKKLIKNKKENSTMEIQNQNQIENVTVNKNESNEVNNENQEVSNEVKDNNEQKSSYPYVFGQNIVLDYPRMIKILEPYLASNDEETQATALKWINEFILLVKETMLPFIPMLLDSVLPSLSHSSQDILLYIYIYLLYFIILILYTESKTFNFQETVNVIINQFQHEQEETRTASMDWLLMLHKKAPSQVISTDKTILSSLLKGLSDSSEEVIKRDLQLLAQIAHYSDENYFTQFMVNLLSLFSTDRRLLENRGSLIIRQLCVTLNPEKIYITFSEILEKEEDLEFASIMIQNLNIILITASELVELRKKLRHLETKEGSQLFVSLYKSWSHNPIATFSLCLLAQAYAHAAYLLQIFSELEITVNFLIQVDKLVQLLESPVFTYLRLQLLEPEKYPALFKCLYGLLMFLPQSSAFATLRNRLSSVSSMVTLNFNESINQLIQTNLMLSQSLSSSPLNNQKLSNSNINSSPSSPIIYNTSHDSPGSSSGGLFSGKR
ncbi:ARM repeat-containing protein [Anaeromyces robustus]|uniref:ARM repeat-containing protein n=1 Tax=Anaeromyces robustus TaxID=1754192 RepID=A0A1Y1VPQ6_9FUNG|nr:ARM repeat-containing protein [Anaeromyces robustus]|eukprot:ORX63249.1 ARM repeat-containing protein [Anaeromyces robustus]